MCLNLIRELNLLYLRNYTQVLTITIINDVLGWLKNKLWTKTSIERWKGSSGFTLLIEQNNSTIFLLNYILSKLEFKYIL